MVNHPILKTVAVILIALCLVGLYITNAELFDPACMGHEISRSCI